MNRCFGLLSLWILLTNSMVGAAEKETTKELTSELTLEKIQPAMCVDPSGRYVALLRARPGLAIIDSTTGKDLFTELGKKLQYVAFSAEGKSVWISDAVGVAVEYSLPDCKELQRREIAKGIALGQLSVSPNGKYLAWRDENARRAGLVETATGKALVNWNEVGCFRGNALRPLITFSPNSELVVFPSSDKKLVLNAKNYAGNDIGDLLFVYDIPKGGIRRSFDYYIPAVMGPAEWSGNQLYYVHRADTWDWELHRYDTKADKVTVVCKLDGNSHFIDLFPSPKGTWIADSLEQDDYQISEATTGKITVPIRRKDPTRKRFVGWEHKDGEVGLVAAVNVKGGLTGVSPTTGKVLHTYQGMEGRVAWLAFPMKEGRLAIIWHSVFKEGEATKHGPLTFSLMRVK